MGRRCRSGASRNPKTLAQAGVTGRVPATCGLSLHHQNSSPFRSNPCTPFSPFTLCVTWKSTASEQNW